MARASISENFSDLTRLLLRYKETCSASSFFKISTARLRSFILAISSRNFGSNSENPVLMSANRLITPSLWMVDFKSSLIRSLMSFKESGLFPPVKRVNSVRTASKKAASYRCFSLSSERHSESACRRSIDSLINDSLCFSFSIQQENQPTLL